MGDQLVRDLTTDTSENNEFKVSTTLVPSLVINGKDIAMTWDINVSPPLGG